MSGEEVIKNQFSTRVTRARAISDGSCWLNFKYILSACIIAWRQTLLQQCNNRSFSLSLAPPLPRRLFLPS
jgi:hypothetical protein